MVQCVVVIKATAHVSMLMATQQHVECGALHHEKYILSMFVICNFPLGRCTVLQSFLGFELNY